MIEHDRTGPLDLLTWCFSRIAMWAPFFIVLIILYEVIMRYFFASATLWVNEMSLWIAGGIYLSGGLYSMQQRSHIRIFIIYDVVPLWMRRLFDVLSTLCVCVFGMAVIYGGFGEANAKFWRWETFGTAFDPPLPATIKPLILTMMLFLSLQVISNLIRDWPSVAWARKTFDLLVTAFIVGLALAALYTLYIVPPEGNAVPLKWQIGIGIFLLASIAIVLFGLVRDFNRTPKTWSDADELAHEVAVLKKDNIPDEILTGNPPKPEE